MYVNTLNAFQKCFDTLIDGSFTLLCWYSTVYDIEANIVGHSFSASEVEAPNMVAEDL